MIVSKQMTEIEELRQKNAQLENGLKEIIVENIMMIESYIDYTLTNYREFSKKKEKLINQLLIMEKGTDNDRS
jgi:hypothetical protein